MAVSVTLSAGEGEAVACGGGVDVGRGAKVAVKTVAALPVAVSAPS